ncbi:hypothetical protein C8R45DRAFT_59705 [Mycena sanguinolenta]|nr:hypothetical protein C8R45DRAFT_59705 [Mycena sanguinolenta]
MQSAVRSQRKPSATTKTPKTRTLCVADAQTYLTAIRKEFPNEPEVFNAFLDIMMDFKNERIDTFMVLQGVAIVLRGNRYLVKGFNCFAPVGYYVDVSKNPAEPNTRIAVTTPNGEITHFDYAHLSCKRPQRPGPRWTSPRSSVIARKAGEAAKSGRP